MADNNFDSGIDEQPAKVTMTVLLVEPGKHPRQVEIGTKLEDLQEAVGGYIEVIYSFEDPVALVMNDEGKLNGLPYNRALKDDDGNVYDVIAGPFLVVGIQEENFGSLTPEQLEAYKKIYLIPEMFLRTSAGLMALPDFEADAEATYQAVEGVWE